LIYYPNDEIRPDIMSAKLQAREGDLQLSKPFSLIIPKPANKTLPGGRSEKSFGWITKVDQLARQEDAASNYTASCWYFAAALEPAISLFGASNINTLHIEQFLAQNLFDNDRQWDAVQLFNDILEKCAQVKDEGKWNFRYTNVAKSVIGCRCEFAQGFYGKRRFGKATAEFEQILKISQNLLGNDELTTKIKSKSIQSAKKKAEADKAKSVLPDASSVSTNKQDPKKIEKIPLSPKLTVEKPSQGTGKPTSPGPGIGGKGKGSASSDGSRSSSHERGREKLPKKQMDDSSTSHTDAKVGKGNSPAQGSVGKTGSHSAQQGKSIDNVSLTQH